MLIITYQRTLSRRLLPHWVKAVFSTDREFGAVSQVTNRTRSLHWPASCFRALDTMCSVRLYLSSLWKAHKDYEATRCDTVFGLSLRKESCTATETDSRISPLASFPHPSSISRLSAARCEMHVNPWRIGPVPGVR